MAKPTNGRAPIQTNAADPNQVARAKRIENDREEQFRAALAEVMQTPLGRLVLGELLERGRLYETSFDHSGSIVYFREGRRNYALEIQSEMVKANEDAYELLERERRARRRSEERGNAAATMSTAEAEGETDGR